VRTGRVSTASPLSRTAFGYTMERTPEATEFRKGA